MASDDHPDRYSMSFGDHLEDLRRRVLWGLAVPLPVAVILFFVSDPLIVWLYQPLDGVLETFDLPRRLQSLGPAEVLAIKIKLSLIFAAVLSAPWIVWQAWLFVRPGLYRHERRFVNFLIPGSAVLTVAGVSLMYFGMLPLMLQVLVLFGASLATGSGAQTDDPRVAAILQSAPSIELRIDHPETPEPGDVWLMWPQLELFVAVEAAIEEGEETAEGNGVPGGNPAPATGSVEIVRVAQSRGSMITQEFRLTTYVNFVLILMIGIVIAFQMPLVILLAGWLGLVTDKSLRAKRKYALFVCAIVAAVITPADALSMVIMLIPLAALYELSILLLIFAPASAVAEGRVLMRWRKQSGDE